MQIDKNLIRNFSGFVLHKDISKDNIKNLNQAERKTLEVMLGVLDRENVNPGNNNFSNLSVDTQTYHSMIRKLDHPEPHSNRWYFGKFINRIAKAILIIFGQRIGSGKVLAHFEHVKSDLQKKVPQQLGFAIKMVGKGKNQPQINFLVKGGRMDAAGFMPGDILVKTTVVEKSQELKGLSPLLIKSALNGNGQNEPVTVTILRDGNEMDVELAPIRGV